MPVRRCLWPKCNTLSSKSYCPNHERLKKAQRNADIKIAKAVVAASPVCVCDDDCRWHKDRVCGATNDLTADHIRPVIAGGTNEGPRQVLCRRCNSRKGGF